MKYVIEIEDEPFGRNDDPNIPHGMDELYRAKGFNSLVFDQFGLDKLTPLDKELDEAYQKGFEAGQHEATTLEYQQGLDDAWECMKAIAFLNKPRDMRDFFGCSTLGDVLIDYTASEAIEKLKAYEERQKADEIKVGDEVEWEGEKIIVTQTFTPNLQKPQLHGIGSNGCVYYAILIEDVKKTGRHFPQVVELIKAMKEGAE